MLKPARGLVVAVVLGLATACTAEPQPQAPATEDPAVEAVREARAALGEPAVAQAESLIALAGDLDAIRHELPRGSDVQAALAGLDTVMAAALEAADGAEAAAEPLEDATPAVAEAADVVDRAVAEARRAVAAAEDERAALMPLAEVDVRLDAAVEAWDEPGSQSQRRSALAALAAELDAVAEQTRELEPVPEGCSGAWDRRTAWARLLAQRTRELEASATGAGGATYDELRARYREQPYGEDRLRADAADRECWQRASAVAAARASAPERVAELEAALNPP